MLDNMKLNHKIYGGFGIIIAILITIAGMSVYSNTGNQSDFSDYRSIARLTNEAGRVQANMLEARLAFTKYQTTQSAENLTAFDRRLTTVKESAVTLAGMARTDVEKAATSGFTTAVSDYENGFKAVVAAQTERDKLVDESLDVIGPRLQKSMNDILADFDRTGNTEAAYEASVFQTSTFVMRLATAKYLLNNETKDFENALAAGQDALANSSAVTAAITSPDRLQQFKASLDDLNTYIGDLKKTQAVITKRNAVITDVMNVVGPKLGKETEDLKLILKKEQDTLGPRIDETMRDSITTAIIVAALALILASVLAFIIARSISRPIFAITSAMGKLADNQLETDIPGLAYDNEVGLMAKAVNVFKQNAIKIRQLAAQDAALQQKNADLQSDIATVVSAAVAGNFTSRITKHYDNPDLDAFAHNVNTLVDSVDKGIAETRRVVSALSNGDLTEAMNGKYQGVFAELQTNVNDTMTKLRLLMEQVRQSADVINGGADEIRQASNDLSRRTETQAASLEETSSALEEITVAVKTSTERAQESSKMVSEARHFAEQSANVVQDATAAMSRIEQASNEITQIINVIDEIAFQTNLLALNAGVEAARAGEAGKGFAVVAQEVRELAQRSATAAKDIKALITKSSNEVETGVRLVTGTGEALKEIQQKVIGISTQVTSIATAANEQSTGLSEVNTAVNQMDQMTQQNAAMVEEAAASTSKLAEETVNLLNLISQFRVHKADQGMRRAA
ncbi:HAMP domain-containing protein [Agrobacterium vitis]|uniref:HAMP domain-containing protein n=1 Tax=Agrobacterium vitis TaxID=373 RepID=A0ABD6GET7_AGRVI|nr:methyl-accepting chemotaxis protein [Agrobacterium vitis]MUO81869.1 HAMP domain-containing protein [Agrobacterium vitis]MUO97731.1 HAMP domain-containing protein [Agrobacterium vitis]MUP07962.1 HAMP domain-containing protein [Agrobacterium vitis]MUZ85254.1 HAMP domain-containing protein [Agrobacterium vitis]MVA12660.1 HAMP domain-containing protein [Agrobacterium vitis]